MFTCSHLLLHFSRYLSFWCFQTKTEAKESGTLVSYGNEAKVPNSHDVKALKIYVGQLHFSLYIRYWLSMFGVLYEQQLWLVTFSGDLKSGLVRILNGQSLSNFLMVWILNGQISNPHYTLKQTLYVQVSSKAIILWAHTKKEFFGQVPTLSFVVVNFFQSNSNWWAKIL